MVVMEFAKGKLKILNDPGPNRTADLPLRRRPLYPLSYRTEKLTILSLSINAKHFRQTTLKTAFS